MNYCEKKVERSNSLFYEKAENLTYLPRLEYPLGLELLKLIFRSIQPLNVLQFARRFSSIVIFFCSSHFIFVDFAAARGKQKVNFLKQFSNHAKSSNLKSNKNFENFQIFVRASVMLKSRTFDSKSLKKKLYLKI